MGKLILGFLQVLVIISMFAVLPAWADVPVDPGLKDTLMQVFAGNSTFALSLYSFLSSSEEGNLFFSPFSISTALGMLYGGAKNETASEMARVLCFPEDVRRLYPAYGGLLREFCRDEPGYRMAIANRLWGQTDFGFEEEFLTLLGAHFGAGLIELDFRRDAEAARKTINSWTEEKTLGKIRELLRPGIISPSTVFVLTNAIYFKGDWFQKFEKADTQMQPFHLSNGHTVDVPMMKMKRGFRYFDGGTFQAIELPYKGNEVSMFVFLPKAVDGLKDFQPLLTPANFISWRSKMVEKGDVSLFLPRFKVTSKFELKKVLSAMGMKTPFMVGADFSGITRRKDIPIFISEVVHKAYIETTEEGSEAAAATAVIAGNFVSRPMETVFRADHPFVFILLDNRFGNILFIGRICGPDTERGP